VSKSTDAITEKSVMQFPGIDTDEPSDQQESSDVKKSQNNKTNDVAYVAAIRNDSSLSSTYDFEQHGNPTDNQIDSNFLEIGPSVSDYNNVSGISKKRLISFIR